MTLEGTLQGACVAYLEECRIYHTVTWGNAWERRGRPDIYICYRGHFIGCELKKGAGERPTPLQLKHLREIERCGGIGIWITTLQELKDLLYSLDSKSPT